MNFLKIAKTAHKAHNVAKEYQGYSVIPWKRKSTKHKQLVVNSVMDIINGNIESAWDAHDQFVNQKLKDGWSFGEEFCEITKTNPRLTSYKNLSDKDRMLDELFFSIVSSFKVLL